MSNRKEAARLRLPAIRLIDDDRSSSSSSPLRRSPTHDPWLLLRNCRKEHASLVSRYGPEKLPPNRGQSVELFALPVQASGSVFDSTPDHPLRERRPLTHLEATAVDGEAESAGARSGRDFDPLASRRGDPTDGEAGDAAGLCAEGGDRQASRALLRLQATPSRLLSRHGEPVVRSRHLHRQHGNLRRRRRRQIGQQPGDPQSKILSTALYARLRQLHERPFRRSFGSLLDIHPG